MKTRPILFSGPMVRALLEARKTQTRRVVKGQALDWLDGAGFTPEFVADPGNDVCPFGKPGDLLWCRETWQPHSRATDVAKVVYRASETASHTEFHRLVPVSLIGNTQPKPFQQGWRPSIHMPRWASRLTLEITGARVERLQDISEIDAQAEGIADGGCLTCGNSSYPNSCGCPTPSPSFRDGYAHLWQQLHGERSWLTNPWVWIIEFRVYQQNIDQYLAHLATTSTKEKQP
jgi:hypothetical protein